ncbi:hypothetical protein PAMP_020423 [Pampus punctatissimus]
MYAAIALVLVVPIGVGLALPGGQSETKTVTGMVGEEITLQTGVTGLHGDYQILWSYGEGHFVIVNFDDGVLKRKTSERFLLDRNTGSLTIRLLSINDTGLYLGQIISGNGSHHNFNLTVVEADPIKPPAESLHDTRSHLPAVVSVALFVAFCIVLVVLCSTQEN